MNEMVTWIWVGLKEISFSRQKETINFDNSDTYVPYFWYLQFKRINNLKFKACKSSSLLLYLTKYLQNFVFNACIVESVFMDYLQTKSTKNFLHCPKTQILFLAFITNRIFK